MAGWMSDLVDLLERQGWRVRQNPEGRWSASKDGVYLDLGPTPTTPNQAIRLRNQLVNAGIRLP